MIAHHLSDEFLIEYANGSLREAESIIVAGHVSMCRPCRKRLSMFEDVAATLLEQGDTAPVALESFDRILTRLEEPEKPETALPEFDLSTLGVIPPPLRPYLGGSLSSLDWHTIGPGIEKTGLADVNDFEISLYRIQAGRKVPAHTHERLEFTLLLEGGFSTGDAHFGRGDVTLSDETVTHSHQIDRDGPCLCLTALNGGMRLTGPFMRLLNPILRL